MKVGRAFFWPQKSSPLPLSVAAYQPLENHRGNIIKFVEAWKKEDANLPGGRWRDGEEKVWEWIHEAACKHDRGKAETFRITRDKKGAFEYSFRGHRFRTPEGMSLFAEMTEQGHHDYSTPEIVRAVARIRREAKTEEERQLHYCLPEALYILSMCDQIEAETAVRAFYGESESRAFLDFILYADDKPDGSFPCGEQTTFRLDPFPFQGPITNSIEYYVWDNPPSDEKRLTEIGRDEEKPSHLRLYTVEVTLCPSK